MRYTGIESPAPPSSHVRETIAQIRFGISQLRASNGHHEFETMARFLARATVSRNILPATGPVSGGGDQGRDFETFASEVPGQVRQIGLQFGLADGASAAFACTLQVDRIEKKITDDVAAIVATGPHPRLIVYYCEANVAVGRRHRLQSLLRNRHQIQLEIFDGTAMAELLGQRDLYWIAQEFLHLPAAALPGPELAVWYEEDLARWRGDSREPTTPGDLVDLSGCIRYAIGHGDAAGDLPFWLEKLAALIATDPAGFVKQRARFEIAVAHLRGIGDLRPADGLVEQYIASALTSSEPTEVGDAATLLMYCVGALGRGRTDHAEGRLNEWNTALQQHVEALLRESRQPGRRCALLETLGWLRAQPDLVAARAEGLTYELPPDVEPNLDDLLATARADGWEPVRVPLVDLSGAFDAWVEMATLLDDAPFFPVERAAQMFQITAPLLAEDDRYDSIVTTIDRRVAHVVGQAAAAAHARDRAMTFYHHNQLVKALRELQRVREGWFGESTNEGFVLASLMVAQIYSELALPQAAKYAALTAARFVGQSDMDVYPRCVFKAAEADYHQGAWHSTLQLIDHAFAAHLLFAEDPYAFERYVHVQYGLFELTVIRGLANAAGPPHSEVVDALVERTGTGELLAEILGGDSARPWWEGLSLEEFLDQIGEELGAKAFADGGQRRLIEWSALGVSWSVECQNDYESTMVAERLAATAQILLADMSTHNPELTPSNVRFVVSRVDAAREVVYESRSDGQGTTWRVALPAAGQLVIEAIRKVGRDTLTVLLAACTELSTLPVDEFMAMVERQMESGLVDKLLLGATYDTAYQHATDREDFAATARTTTPALSQDPGPRPNSHPELVPTAPGAKFDRARSLEMIGNRYAANTKILVATLPALRAHAPFHQVVSRLRDDGWKDWHILLAILNIAQNHHHPYRQPNSADEAKQLAQRFWSPEVPGQPAPLALFDEQALRAAIRFSWVSTLRAWGLDIRQNPPDMDAVETLISQRYAYWDDDVPHDDPFGPID